MSSVFDFIVFSSPQCSNAKLTMYDIRNLKIVIQVERVERLEKRVRNQRRIYGRNWSKLCAERINKKNVT